MTLDERKALIDAAISLFLEWGYDVAIIDNKKFYYKQIRPDVFVLAYYFCWKEKDISKHGIDVFVINSTTINEAIEQFSNSTKKVSQWWLPCYYTNVQSISRDKQKDILKWLSYDKTITEFADIDNYLLKQTKV